MSLTRQTASGALWNMLANSSTQIANLIVFIVLARQLDPAEFGTAILAVLLVNFLMIFIKEGIVEKLVQAKELTNELMNSAFLLLAALGVGLAVFLGGVIGPLLSLRFPEVLSDYTFVLSFTLLFNGLSAANLAIVRREFRFRTIALRNFINGLVTTLVALLLAMSDFGAWSLIWSRLIGATSAALLLWYAAPVKPSSWGNRSDRRTLIGFSQPIVVSKVMTYFGQKAVEFLLALVLGPAALAIFRLGIRVHEALMSLIVHPVVQVSLTTFSKVARADINSVFLRLWALLSAVILPLSFGSAAIAEDFVTLLFGDKWNVSAYVMILVGFAATPLAFRLLLPAALKALGETSSLYRYSLNEVMTGVLFALLTVQFGPMAVAFGVLLEAHSSIFLNRKVAAQKLDISLVAIMKSTLPFLMGAIVMFVFLKVFQHTFAVDWHPISRLIASVGLGALIYLLYMGLFARTELRQLIR